MSTLLINTVSQQPQIALWDTTGKLLGEKTWDGFRHEADTLLPEVQRLLEQTSLEFSDLKRLIGVVGPGGFTSSRIGVSAVHALAYALGLEVAELTLFDLYPADRWTIFSANRSEAWVRPVGAVPAFVTEELITTPFSYSGEVSDEWKALLERKGCTFEPLEPLLPDVTQLTFEKKALKPWYYKEANITWSPKHEVASVPVSC